MYIIYYILYIIYYILIFGSHQFNLYHECNAYNMNLKYIIKILILEELKLYH